MKKIDSKKGGASSHLRPCKVAYCDKHNERLDANPSNRNIRPEFTVNNSTWKAADVPKYALSMGVGTILEAKTVALLAFGANKADAIKGAVEGGVSQFCTASALQMHPDAWFFCDEAAAAKLKLKKYYAWRGREELARRG